MYTLITQYDDGFTKSETVHNISDLFAAAAIYAIDEECVQILGIDSNKNFVIDFSR